MRPKLIACDGEVRSQRAWSRHLGGSGALVNERIRQYGWPACRAATLPVNVALSAAQKRSWRAKALRRLVRLGGVFRPRGKATRRVRR